MQFVLYVLKIPEYLAPCMYIYTHTHAHSWIFAEFSNDQIFDFKILSSMKEKIMKFIFASIFVFILFCKKSKATSNSRENKHCNNREQEVSDETLKFKIW